MSVIDISNRREVMWDYHLIDRDKTTAALTMGKLQKKEKVITFDKLWEGDSISYPHTVKDGDLYRMYYITTISDLSKMKSKDGVHEDVVHNLCCIESKDGINWYRPKLTHCKWMDFDDNNIVIKGGLDNFFVFIDENPSCPKEEKYKGLFADDWGRDENGIHAKLHFAVSEDGIHFERRGVLLEEGQFDSLNTAYWCDDRNKYICFYRRITDGYNGFRKIFFAESPDFKNWTIHGELNYSDGNPFPLYTNGVAPYYRAPHILSGIPTRYVERQEWTPNYDALPSPEIRKKIMEAQPRYGLALTDAMFMCSRDGKNWQRMPEAFMAEGLEHEGIWFYGDCYPTFAPVETKDENGNSEMSFYVTEGHWDGKPTPLVRYTLRLDGFSSFYGGYDKKTVVTKPIKFSGNTMEMNFRTSVAGSIRVNILDEDGRIISGFKGIEMFGNNTKRRVYFESGSDVSALSGKTIRLEFILCDAHIYSYMFCNE